MKVAAVQMVSGTMLDENLAQATVLIARAAQMQAELVVLPEYFCLMGLQNSDKLTIQEPFGAGPIQQFLSDMARIHQVWLVGGTLPISTHWPDKVTNSSLVYSPQGTCVARYEKIHLFRYQNAHERYDEAQTLQAGTRPTVFTMQARDGQSWTIGLSVCYDLRFPELYRAYAQQGAQIMLVPSAFTATTGAAHWEVLLRARAIENLAYVLAAAQGGQHANGRRTWGHSMVVDPWGSVLAEQAEHAGVVVAELVSTRVQGYRQQLPALTHRVLT